VYAIVLPTPLARPGFGLALPLSVALHALVILALAGIQWAPPDERLLPLARPAPRVVWLGDWSERQQRAVPPLAAEAGERPRAVTPQTAPPQTARPPVDVEPRSAEPPAAEPQPARRVVEVERPAPRPERAVVEIERPSPRPERAVVEAEPPAPAAETDETAVDLETLRRDAITAVLDQTERDNEYMTFSLEDLDEDDAPPPEPGADVDVFEPSPGSGGRGVLRPGSGRTKLGRWLADTCNALTGGFGFFGLGVCAENRARSDLFAHLKPAYLQKLPLCTETAVAASAGGAGGTEAATTIKCRLVTEEERAALANEVADQDSPSLATGFGDQ
jgi:hypothetical protein